MVISSDLFHLQDLIRSLDRHFHLLHSRMGELEERLEARHQVEAAQNDRKN